MNPKMKQLHENLMMLKVVVTMMGLCLAGNTVGPPLYWHISEVFISSSLRYTSSYSSCPSCLCDCPSQPLFSLPKGMNKSSFTDCMKHEPEANEEMEEGFIDLLKEELELREAEVVENHKSTDMALLEARKMGSQYQKEADKCNSGMETCEDAREKAEAALEAQKKLTTMWQIRAQRKGWRKDSLQSCIKPTNGPKKAEATIEAQKKPTRTWKFRARKNGFWEGAKRSRAKPANGPTMKIDA